MFKGLFMTDPLLPAFCFTNPSKCQGIIQNNPEPNWWSWTLNVHT